MAVKPKKFVDKDGNQLSSIVHEKYVKDSNGNRLSDKISELSTVVAENKDQIDNLRDFVSSNTVKVSQRTTDINLNESSIKNGESFNLLKTANLRHKNLHASHYRVTYNYRIDCFLHGNQSNRVGTYYSIIKLTYLSDEDVTGVLLGYIYSDGRMYNSSGKNTSSIDGHNLEEWNYFITSLFNESVATIYDQGMMSAEDKIKLDGITANANHTEIADNLTTNDSTKTLSAKQGKLLNDKIKEKASMSNIAAYMNAGDVMPYADVYTFFIEYGSTTYPVHWNTWLESDGETPHTAFCVYHNEGKGIWYIDYKNTEEGLEFVSTYDDASTVPDVILEAVGDKASVDVVDNLTTNDSTKALSAKQGKVLNDQLTNLIFGEDVAEDEIPELLNAGDVVLYKTATYAEGTVGAEIAAINEEIDNANLSQLARDVSQISEDKLEVDSVKDNGNIVLKDGAGNKKEYMAATPSGDPRHYVYISFGAVWNQNTGFWELNELADITTEQMSLIHDWSIQSSGISSCTVGCVYAGCPARTLYKPKYAYSRQYNSNSFYCICCESSIEIIYLNSSKTALFYLNVSGTQKAFYNSKIRRIYGVISTSVVFDTSSFQNAKSLEYVLISGLRSNLNLSDSKNFEVVPLTYIINNAYTNSITITLHADAYSRAMEDSGVQSALAAHTNVSLVSA